MASINFSVALKDAWGKPILLKEGSEETFTLGDAVVDALNFPGKQGKERSEDDKRRRWRLALRLTQPAGRVEDSAKYPVLEVGAEPKLTPDDLAFMQKALHERFDSPMIYAQAYDLLCLE